MDLLAHYVRIHLTGAAAGLELFGRGADLHDPEARATTARIRHELVEERDWLRGLVKRLGSTEPTLAQVTAKLGERLGRLKPNGHLLHRTPLTDVIDLESMHDALSGKVAGWKALLEVEGLEEERDALERLLAQGQRQIEQVTDLHRVAARRAWSAT
ncbi:MAG: hypothetical protein P1U38_14960 [Aeromicrobium sp.]|uniref:hypothetical protein n=1 Tax=Aeromicrobium sp. TaxID=1871063 RepID=UPI0025BFAB6D|nr:hypothetical protein [Aeromicrobium sp.]MCK5892392.1 hypothetical protein [Aeromicrobium sp.]MDF1706066.1 hypothetical protein [Aeromicrobium sp.]